MLFAAGVDVNSQEYQNGVLIGSLVSGAVCGLWPLLAGFSKGRPIAGVVGFLVCTPCGYLLGCLLALPVAVAFHLLIAVLPAPKPSLSGDSRDGPSDVKCGRCGILLMAGDRACYSCRQPVGRADGTIAPVALVVAAVAAGLGFLAVKMLFPW